MAAAYVYSESDRLKKENFLFLASHLVRDAR